MYGTDNTEHAPTGHAVNGSYGSTHCYVESIPAFRRKSAFLERSMTQRPRSRAKTTSIGRSTRTTIFSIPVMRPSLGVADALEMPIVTVSCRMSPTHRVSDPLIFQHDSCRVPLIRKSISETDIADTKNCTVQIYGLGCYRERQDCVTFQYHRSFCLNKGKKKMYSHCSESVPTSM